MAALGKNKGPYSIDAVTVTHKEARITTIVNSPVYDKILADLENKYTYEVGYVPQGYAHRPDLIANVFYGSPKNWWLLMLVNNVTDPFEGFKVNEKILIPRLK
jgi:hypothetical protein